MISDSVESAFKNINKYLANKDIATPFFIVVDDSTEYSDIITGLNSFTQIHASDYCANDDAYPDIDKLCETLSTITGNRLLLGFGESVSFSGDENVVGRLKDLNIASKIVVVCHGIRAAINRLCKEDKKFDSRRICFLKAGIPYEIIKISSSLGFSATDGFKKLLFHLENGASGKLFVKTALHLRNIRELRTAYDAILELDPDFSVSRDYLPDEIWTEFLSNRNLKGFNLFH